MTFAILGTLAATALAQAPAATSPAVATADAQSPRAIAPAANELHFSLTAGVWLPRLGGDVKFGPSPAAGHLNLEEDFNLDASEATLNFEAALTKGEKWQIDLSGFDFSTDSSGEFGLDGAFGDVTFSTGDAYAADFDMSSLALSVSCWQWHVIDAVKRDGPLDLRFSWGAGIRYLNVDQKLRLTGTGASADADGTWLIPELILQLDLNYDIPESFPVLDRLQVLGWISAGPAIGGDGGAVFSLRAGMRGWIGHNFSIDFGYRLLEASVQNDEYELEGGLQGLFFSGTLRF